MTSLIDPPDLFGGSILEHPDLIGIWLHPVDVNYARVEPFTRGLAVTIDEIDDVPEGAYLAFQVRGLREAELMRAESTILDYSGQHVLKTSIVSRRNWYASQAFEMGEHCLEFNDIHSRYVALGHCDCLVSDETWAPTPGGYDPERQYLNDVTLSPQRMDQWARRLRQAQIKKADDAERRLMRA